MTDRKGKSVLSRHQCSSRTNSLREYDFINVEIIILIIIYTLRNEKEIEIER